MMMTMMMYVFVYLYLYDGHCNGRVNGKKLSRATSLVEWDELGATLIFFFFFFSLLFSGAQVKRGKKFDFFCLLLSPIQKF